MRRNTLRSDVLFLCVALPAVMLGIFLCGPVLFQCGLAAYLAVKDGPGTAWDLLSQQGWLLLATLGSAGTAWWSLRYVARSLRAAPEA